jgi:hypothetical protein
MSRSWRRSCGSRRSSSPTDAFERENPPKRAPSLHWFHAAKLVSKIVVSTDPGRVEDPINLLLRERFFFLFLDLS